MMWLYCCADLQTPPSRLPVRLASRATFAVSRSRFRILRISCGLIPSSLMVRILQPGQAPAHLRAALVQAPFDGSDGERQEIGDPLDRPFLIVAEVQHRPVL